ncbi:MAG: hypothetical protein EAX91_13315 [Candidatus Lokiarchaeota archaeon]|nr:hypothetical protein [Candidatus Lokiarchaeota archaeon]
MIKLSKFEEDYLLLALRINKHIKGYVDFYYGPENLRKIVESEFPMAPIRLLKDSRALIQHLQSQGYDLKRERFLEKIITSMKTSIEMLNGIDYSIKDQFLKLYDVNLDPAYEIELKNLKEEINEAYEGPGNITEHMANLRLTRRVPEAQVFTMFQKALNIVRKQTKKILPNLLPKEEQISIDLVEQSNYNLKWSFYNWYQGNYKSRIELNPKYDMYWTAFLSAASHEGYPGHHTEFSVKEQMLYHELNHFEQSILIIHSPQMIISEGIAKLANSILFSNIESAEISLREFCPDISKEVPLEILILQDEIKAKISVFWYNFAYHALVDKYNEEELVQFGKGIGLFSEEQLKNEIERILNPVYSKNAFLYYLGTNILRKKYGKIPSIKEYKSLLVNPILPSDLN